jgi:hypothetical protein
LKRKLVGHRKWIGTAGMNVPESVYQLADPCTRKNCTLPSRTEEFRELPYPFLRQSHKSDTISSSLLADFDISDGSKLQHLYLPAIEIIVAISRRHNPAT